MHDPTNDTEPTPHDFESLPVDEYAAAKAERYRKKRQDMDAAYEKANGACWPVPLAGDRTEDEES